MANDKASLLIELKDMISGSLAKIGGNMDKFAANLDKSKFVTSAVAGATALLAKAFISAADKMEQWTLSFTTMLGSAGKAKKLMEEIQKFAATTPFELPDVIVGAKRLLAFGIEQDKIISSMKMLGDTAAGIGVDLERLLVPFGKIKTKGKASMEELNMILEAGVPILDVLAKNFGVTTEELFKMVSAGKIGFKDVENAFITMTSAGGAFNNAMSVQMITFSGIVSNLKDQFFKLSVELGQYLLPIAKKIANTIIGMITWFSELSSTIKIGVLVLGGLIGALAGVFVGLTAWVLLAPALTAAGALVSASLASITLPIILIGGAITGLIAIFGGLITNAFGMRDIMINIFTELGTIISLLAGAISDALSFKFTAAKDKTAQAFKQMKDLATNSVNELTANIKTSLGMQEKDQDKHDADSIIKQKAKIKVKDTAETEGYFVSMDKFRKHNKEWDDLFMKQNTNMLNVQNDSLIKYDAKDMQQKAGYLDRLKAWFTAQSDIEKFSNAEKLTMLQTSLTNFATLSTAHNKTLARIGKASAISEATIATYLGVANSLKVGWPWGLVLAAGALAAGMMNVAKISGVALAEGGIVMPRSGGIQATIGEGGRAEAVIPLGDSRAKEQLRETLGGGETIINVNAGVIVADDYSLRQLARMIDEKLFELKQNRQTLSI